MTRAIVTGISGQDGFFMAQLLAQRGVSVVGLTTDAARARAEYGPAPWLTIEDFDYGTAGAFGAVVARVRPDLVFNFAALSSGQGMFDAPQQMARLNGGFVLDILEAIHADPRREMISFCQASSAEMFGDVAQSPQDETTPFRPKSPYGAAKLYAHNLVGIYRRAYGLRACSAIFYNHESARRSPRFVTRKIADAAAAISLGRADHVMLGDLSAERDWGHAPEYMEAMFRMANAVEPGDYVIATGTLHTVRDLCEVAFGHVGLDYRNHVRAAAGDNRVVNSVNFCGNPAKACRDLGWQAQRPIADVMRAMVDHARARLEA